MHTPQQNTLPHFSWRALAAGMAMALLGSCGGGGGGTAATTPDTPPVAPAVPGAYADATLYASDPLGMLATPNENAAVIHSAIQLAGKPFAYTATTGHLTASDLSTGQPAASFFYVAYTAGTPDAKRPLTFFYNGGPGSASLWLHLGSFGPRRLVTAIPNATVAPLQVVDNQETLLEHSDLVFVDAIGTGYSQAVAPNANQDFWGVDRDAAAFRDFVRRYVEVNQREGSPKFLFGESYGTPRTAVLANLLETAGVQIDGLMLQSSILDYNSNCGIFSPNTISCEGYVPTYAATGAYFLRSTPLPTDLAGYLQQARDFSAGPYRSAMSGWLNGRVAPGASVTTQLFDDTGIATLTWQQNFDLGPDSFQASVLPGQQVGRYDARVAAPTGSALAAGGDPSLTVIDSSFVSAIASYVAGELHYTARSTYVANNDIVSRWAFQHDGKALPDTVPDLSAALTLNPAMQVLSLNGYYDLATPFRQTELDLARLGSDPAIRLRYYASGHMSYLDDAARRAEQADLISFYNSVLAAR